jgi:regulator of protease activity HflC (stomatin/prohibitin superfamily)
MIELAVPEGIERGKKKGAWTAFLVKVVVCVIVFIIALLLDVWIGRTDGWLAYAVGMAALLLLAWSFPKREFHRLLIAGVLVFAVAVGFAFLIQEFITLRLARYVQGSIFEEATFQGLIAFLLGLPVGILAVSLPLLAVMLVSSEFILALNKDPYNRTLKDSLRLLLSLIFQTNYPWLIVAEGEEVQSRPSGLLKALGGPGLVVIRPGNAVVFERGGQVSRIVEAGIVLTKLYEQIKAIVDLRPKWTEQPLEDVLTRDRVPLKITFGVGFQIESCADVEAHPESWVAPNGEALSKRLDGVYPVYEATVRKAVYNCAAPKWESLGWAISAAQLRDVVATYNLDEIFRVYGEPDEKGFFRPNQRTIERIEGQVHEGTAVSLRNFGIKHKGIDIREIKMPEEVHKRMVAVWETEWKNRIRLEEAKAEGTSRVHLIKAVGTIRSKISEDIVDQVERMVKILTDMPDGVSIRFIRAFEQLSRNAVSDDVVATRYIEALETMAKSAGTKALFISEGKPEALGPGELHDISERMEKSD